MNKELEKLYQEIDELKAEIDKINEDCATAISEFAGANDRRILSYAQQQELDEIIDKHTKKLASLILKLEELEEVKSAFDTESDEE